MRFTIRDLLWLMVVVGLGCGWLVEHAAWRSWQHREWLNDIESHTRNILLTSELGRQNKELEEENSKLRMKVEKQNNPGQPEPN